MFGHNKEYVVSSKKCLFCGQSLQQHKETKEFMCAWLKCKLFGGQYKMVNIDGKYFIQVSAHGLYLLKKYKIKEGKNKDKEDYEKKGEYSSISSIIKTYEKLYKTQDAIKAEVATDLKSLKDILEKIDSNAMKLEARILEQLKPHQGGDIK